VSCDWPLKNEQFEIPVYFDMLSDYTTDDAGAQSVMIKSQVMKGCA
jgi:hypothetical protein